MKILFVSRHFPPEVSGGARRPYLYVKYLRRLGHDVEIVVPFQSDDENSLVVPHRAYGSHEVSSGEPRPPQKPKKVRNFLRQWLLWPDPDIRWANAAYKQITTQTFVPDIILSTSPAESVHILGKRLSLHFNCPWVAEFRDTWIENPHRVILKRSGFRRIVERQIARNTLKHADGITSVSQFVMREVETYCLPNTPQLIITHFSDRSDSVHEYDNDDINLLHSGGFTLSDRRRTMSPLLDIIEPAAKTNPRLHLHITGQLTNEEKAQVKSRVKKVTLHGQVPLATSLSMQNAADGLILYTPKNSHALPGKFAEYVQANRPIYVLGGGDWTQLVENPDILIPLSEGLPRASKGAKSSYNIGLSAEAAAKQLSTFFEAILK